MSDTDKDKPYWVVAAWWESVHWGCPTDVHRRRVVRDCDLPVGPVIHRPERLGGRRAHCRWEPDYRGPVFRHVPRWYVNHVWNGPQRRTVRDTGRRAVAEFRATGAVDVEPPVGQHRHGARWLWE